MAISVNHEKDIFEKGDIKIVSRLKMARMPDGDHAWHWKNQLIKRKMPVSGGMNSHAVIIGESGSGKSNACKALILSLLDEKCNFIVLDPHNEYIGMADHIRAKVHNCANGGINIFETDGMGATEKSSELTLMFTKHMRLGHYQSSVLYKCLKYMYNHTESSQNPNIYNLIRVMDGFLAKADKKEISALATIRQRLEMLHGNTISGGLNVEQLMSSNNVLALSELHTPESQVVFIEGFLRKIYSTMLSMRKPKNKTTYIVIEEAGKLGECEILKRLISEGRKYGIGIIAVTQSAKSLDREVRINAALFISFYQREPEELNYVANFISGGNEGKRFIEVKKALRSLVPNRALVLCHGMLEPVIVKIAPIRYRKENLDYSIDKFTAKPISKGELCRKLYPQGFNFRQAEAAIERLTIEAKLRSYVVEGCGEFDGKWYVSNPTYTPEHDVMVEIISKKLTEVGISNRIHNKADGPDVIGYTKEGKIAFEYETGRNSRGQFAAELARRKGQDYLSIIVIVNSEKLHQYLQYKGEKWVRVITEKEFLA